MRANTTPARAQDIRRRVFVVTFFDFFEPVLLIFKVLCPYPSALKIPLRGFQFTAFFCFLKLPGVF